MKTQAEKIFHTIRAILVIALTFGVSSSIWAMNHNDHPNGHNMHMASEHKTMQKTVIAEVKRVQLHNGKITLKHGELDELDMPPMTMSFSADDPTMLEGLKRGDQVQFRSDSKMKLLEIQKTID
ncbi:copper-binding protein [Thiomicrorhabdus sp. 6S2-11]|uniref:Copper-binding protein n=1 Tax=Thiomicrorhabdus marina TaxID=2818442 RepID=A0ABS3Q2Y3_9GAMM|nr:copper-binding protein [Thiomicrorhabdus marina]MBO1926170.1 copper-binding protein [Thiomicrorhabdus marina]